MSYFLTEVIGNCPVSGMNPRQSKAARALLNWSQDALASMAGVSVATLRDFERGKRTPIPQNLKALRTTLEGAGIEFIDGNGSGQGVVLHQPDKS